MSDRPTLFAPCSAELLAATKAAARAREQTMAGFVRLAVQRAISEAGFSVETPTRKKKLARPNGRG